MTKRPHAMFPDAKHDESSRQSFVRSFMGHLYQKVMPGNDILYKTRVVPHFEKELGRPPETRKEVREALGAEPYNQIWGSMMRTSQEMLYDSVRPSIERQMPELREKANRLHNSPGSLSLNPDMEMPKYHTGRDIHCKPGGYHTQTDDEDFLAGAEYDRSLMVYFQGKTGPLADDMGLSLATWVKENYPDVEPRMILDMGCTIGHSTLPYVDVFPSAEVHAIDVAAPCVTYAHHRAKALAKAVHFSQQNAEKTYFEDGSFDLIVSHILMHETSHQALRNIFAECYRLLKPGGMVLHMDIIGAKDVYGKYFADWNAHYNNEPYMGSLQDEDFCAIYEAAGFPSESYLMTQIPSVHLPNTMPEVAEAMSKGVVLGIGHYTIVGARKPKVG